MSQWTHVNASIRFDTLLGIGAPTKQELGKICKWDDEDDSHWENTFMPLGSEGGLEYTIVNTGCANSAASHAVIFTGDLRDYDDAEEILGYFKRIVKDKVIRSGILEIAVEYKAPIVYRYDGEDKMEWVRYIHHEK